MQPPVPEPDAGMPARAVIRALLVAMLQAALLLGVYYLIPLRLTRDATVIASLVVGLIVFAVVVVLQLRAVLRAPYPALRAIQALTSAIPLFLLLFAATYFLLSQAQPATFSQPLTRTDALYFTVTVFATVGFGDIVAETQAARALVTLQMVTNLVVLGGVVNALVGAARKGRQRQEPTSGAESEEADPTNAPPGQT